MKARHLFTALLALTTVTAVACDDEDEDPNGPPDTNTFEASLTGAQEVPPVTTTANASATSAPLVWVPPLKKPLPWRLKRILFALLFLKIARLQV